MTEAIQPLICNLNQKDCVSKNKEFISDFFLSMQSLLHASYITTVFLLGRV